jgi:DNA-binding IclR family transcriptional regulator
VSQPSRVVGRLVDVVNFLASSGPASVGEVAQAVGIARSNVYRAVEGLVEADLARIDANGGIVLTRRWLHLGELSRRGMAPWPNARDVLRSIADRTAQTVYLIVPEDDHVLCVEWAPGRGTGVLELKPGGTLPLYAGAAGRLALAFGPVDVEGYLANAPFPELTPLTLIDSEALRADVALTRRRGFVISDEDVTVGVVSIGVAIIENGEYRASLSVGGIKSDVIGRRDEFLGHLRDGVAALTDPRH